MMFTDIRRIEEITNDFLFHSKTEDVIALDVDFDIIDLKEKCAYAIDKFGLIEKAESKNHFGLALQCVDDNDPYFGPIHTCHETDPALLSSFVRPYDKLNDVGRLFSGVFERFSQFVLWRGRLLVAKPSIDMAPHVDGPWRLHIPVVTDSKNLMYIEGREYHFPADGRAYLLNTAKLHRVVNTSLVSRIHLVFDVIAIKA